MKNLKLKTFFKVEIIITLFYEIQLNDVLIPAVNVWLSIGRKYVTSFCIQRISRALQLPQLVVKKAHIYYFEKLKFVINFIYCRDSWVGSRSCQSKHLGFCWMSFFSPVQSYSTIEGSLSPPQHFTCDCPKDFDRIQLWVHGGL